MSALYWLPRAMPAIDLDNDRGVAVRALVWSPDVKGPEWLVEDGQGAPSLVRFDDLQLLDAEARVAVAEAERLIAEAAAVPAA